MVLSGEGPSGRCKSASAPENTSVSTTSFERWFLGCLGLFYALNLILTPPYQVPDESAHFYRAYQLSTGTVWGQKGASVLPDGRTREDSGGDIPVVLEHDFGHFSELQFHPERHLSFDKWRAIARESPKLTPEATRVTGFRGTQYVLLPPVSYAPVALGILAARVLELTTLHALYFGRAANMAFALIVLYGTMRALGPCEKWKLGVLCLAGMPMTAFLLPSVSADSTAIGFSLLVVSLGLRLGDCWNERRFVAFLACAFLLALCKPPYSVLAFMILPTICSSGRRWGTKTIQVALVLALSAGTATLWQASVAYLVIPFRSDINGSLTMRDQVAFFLRNPVSLSFAFARQFLVVRAFEYWRSFVGVLGWLDTLIPVSVTWGYSALLATAALFGCSSDRERETKPWWSRWWNVALVAGVVYLVMLSQYLVWSRVGSFEVFGIQGRYFIPPAALLLLQVPGIVRLSPGRFSVLKRVLFLSWGALSSSVVATLLARYWGFTFF